VSGRRAGTRLFAGLALVVGAALVPAGLGGREVIPAWSWAAWGLAFAAGSWAFFAGGSTAPQVVRRVAWLLPFVAFLALPAALLVPPGRRTLVAAALVARALSASTAAAGTAFLLGPTGLVEGARALRVPERLVEVLHASLVSAEAMVAQARAMLRAREARRARLGPWGSLVREPAATVTGFGRFAGALLVRTMERAEAVERARRARGADLA
jgi:energy-coupling factor transporter transmembrane protein EcfT